VDTPAQILAMGEAELFECVERLMEAKRGMRKSRGICVTKAYIQAVAACHARSLQLGLGVSPKGFLLEGAKFTVGPRARKS
jgi:hypothetical protein